MAPQHSHAPKRQLMSDESWKNSQQGNVVAVAADVKVQEVGDAMEKLIISKMTQ